MPNKAHTLLPPEYGPRYGGFTVNDKCVLIRITFKKKSGGFRWFESIPHMLRKAPTNLAELKTRLRVRAHGSTNL